MAQSALPPTPVVLASFFKRLEGLENILRVILSDARISALMTFRGDPDKKVLLDFSRFPARIVEDENAREATIQVAVRGDVMHDILLDRIKPGVAVGQREMLLRGSAINLAKFIPLFDFGPLLYREHLTDMGIYGFCRPTGNGSSREVSMNDHQFKGDPIPLVQYSPLEKVMFGMINGLSYVLGYVVGTIRFRLFKNMNLFDVLSAMSQGLEAAAPREKTENGNG